MKITTGESKPYERVRIPDETYNATFKSVKEIKDGKFGKRVALIFDVDVDGKIVELAKVVYLKTATPRTELGIAILAMGGKIDGKELELDSLIGSKCRVAVEDYNYEVEENGKMITKTASGIQKIKPLAQKV